MAETELSEFDPAEVARIVSEALSSYKVLPITFIETTLFERLGDLLSSYMNSADVVYIISQLREHFISGFTRFTSQSFHTLVHNCKKCTEINISPVKPWWNVTDPDLMILVENPRSIENYSDLLVNVLKQSSFTSNRCSVSFVTRCPVAELTSTILSNCIPYLHTEIAVLNPKLIITLGLSSYSALSGDHSAKLSDIRGSISWLGPYAILPEASLASIAYGKDNQSQIVDLILPTFLKAHSFLYGEKNVL